ncbi:MAG: hypothetical protein K8J08_07040 [Thermoanaerobaculia bacterium]|nr:hypothetical protein [Thermoanaerobaculia bacterium]
MRKRRTIALLGLAMATVAMATSQNAPNGPIDQRTAQDAFQELASLEGNWGLRDSEKDFRISFELIANQTVLVETWFSNGQKHSLTVYHLDHDRLLATHYCPQGNQPRLLHKPGSETEAIAFEYLDATNLPSLEQSHQSSLSFDLSNPSGLLRRTESYRQGDEEESSTLVLERLGQDQASRQEASRQDSR